MKRSTLSTTIFLLALSVVIADTPKEHHECPAPIGVMGEHQHKAGEMMLGYRFMTMNMQGLQSGTDAVLGNVGISFPKGSITGNHPNLDIKPKHTLWERHNNSQIP